MAYVVGRFTGDRAKEFARAAPPLGAGFPETIASRTDKVIWEGSSFPDPGPDWNRFTAYDEAGYLLDVRTIEGY
jgi:hypothetical protein